MNNDAILHEILAKVDQMQEMPHVALKVNKMIDEPDMDARELAKVILMDPALTTQVLKLCNSSAYGFSRKISTISEAVSILGYKTLKQVLFTIISHGALNRPVEGYALEKGALWQNAITCGVYAKHIAEKVDFKDSELIFISAILRDIGKIALESYLDGSQTTIEDIVKKKRCTFLEAEEEVIGVNHVRLGSELASRWNLPESLVNTIAYYHQPSLIPPDLPQDHVQLISIIHLANIFTMMTGTGVGLDGLMYTFDPVACENLNIPLEELESLFSEMLNLSETIDEMSTTFEMQGA